MFKFLKDKLKNVVTSFSDKLEEESEAVEDTPIEEKKEEEVKEPEEKPIEEVKESQEEPEVKEIKEEPETTEEENAQKLDVSGTNEVGKEETLEEDIKEVPEEKKRDISAELEKEMEDTKDELEEDYIEKKEPVEEPPEIKEEYKKIDDVEEKIEEGIKGEEQLEKKEEVKVEETHDEEAKEILEKSTKGFFGKIKDKFAKKEEVKEPQEEPKEEEIKKVEEPQEKKGVGGWLSEKVTKSVISEEKFDNLFWDMEVVLLENNVAVEVIEKIKGDLKENIVGKPIQRGKIGDTVTKSLQSSINELFDVEQLDIIERVKQKKPLVIVFAGINGSGKTTTIAKLTQLLLDNGLKCVLAASDTFRAASIEQLQKHADALNVKMIKHDYGADPAAVGFDAVKYAEAKGLDVVLIDTAGRLHSNTNLMQEMEKVIRVVKPDLKIFIGESITGNDCVEQARKFDEAIGLDGIILSKADVDEKGGAAISVSYVTKKPILYIGTGQTYADLKPFNPSIITESLGLSA